ncbi:hypothetical protein RRG08_018175 [Elysia crispata]|uniref:Uncharacterized protein n=1 Tax=Elysia crispata TaxID=231223 RepID=A0AAE1DPL3_9GAST|nr:hypothetical protein RRG08_018175 [Elysia crispata]
MTWYHAEVASLLGSYHSSSPLYPLLDAVYCGYGCLSSLCLFGVMACVALYFPSVTHHNKYHSSKTPNVSHRTFFHTFILSELQPTSPPTLVRSCDSNWFNDLSVGV